MFLAYVHCQQFGSEFRETNTVSLIPNTGREYRITEEYICILYIYIYKRTAIKSICTELVRSFDVFRTSNKLLKNNVVARVVIV